MCCQATATAAPAGPAPALEREHFRRTLALGRLKFSGWVYADDGIPEEHIESDFLICTYEKYEKEV